ncbi:MAG: type IV pilus biogenesis protein PilM [Nitrospirota bacterium]
MIKTGLHIGIRHLSLVRVKKFGKKVYLNRYKIIDIPEGLIITSPVESNISDEEEFNKRLAQLFDSTIKKDSEISLSLPDQSVRLLLLELDFIPSDRRELEGIIRWNMEKKSLQLFNNTRLSYQILEKASTRSNNKNLLLVSTIKDNILQQYEEIITSYRVQPVIIDVSSFHIFNLFHNSIITNPALKGHDFIFLSLTDITFTIMVFKRGILDFTRIKGFRDNLLLEDENRDIIISKTIEELKLSLSFYSKGKDLSQIANIFIFADTAYKGIYQRIENELSLKTDALSQKMLPFLKGFSEIKEEEYSEFIPAIAAAIGR